MISFAWWLLTSLWGVAGFSIIGFLASIAPWAGWVNGPGKWLARVLAIACVAMLGFSGGYQTANDRALIDKLRDEAKAERSRAAELKMQLDGQRIIATIAANERDEAREQSSALRAKVSDYERQLASQKPVRRSGKAVDTCSIDDADLRWRRSLRQPAGPGPAP